MTSNSVSIKPIIFSGEMVRALLEGRKTQTRRVMKVQPPEFSSVVRVDLLQKNYMFEAHLSDVRWRLDPVFGVGDLLWVRETFWIAEYYSYGSTPGGCEISAPPLACRRGSPLFYAADGSPPNVGNRTYGPEGLRNGAFAAPDPYAIWIKNPSIHMPRWASRLTLRVTNVRAERLQDISRGDAILEGASMRPACNGCMSRYDGWSMDWAKVGAPSKFGVNGALTEQCISLGDPQAAFLSYWTDLYGEHETKSVGANPWVWVYEFEVIRKNVGEVMA